MEEEEEVAEEEEEEEGVVEHVAEAVEELVPVVEGRGAAAVGEVSEADKEETI